MNGNPFKAPIFVFLMCWAILTAGKSFAQPASPAGGEDSSSDEQAGQENAQMTMEQIRDEELRIQNDLNRLDALDRSDTLNRSDAVNQALDQAEGTIVQATPKQEVSAHLVLVEQASDSQAFAGQIPAKEAPVQAAPVPTASVGSTPPTPSTNTFKISGEARAAMGIDSGGNAIFRRANADLNERNWRILSDAGLNHDINTYDPAIFSRLKLVMDASILSSVVSFHLNLVADPWSYTGKSNAQLVRGEGGDTAKVQYLFWGNTGYTLNTIINTLKNGDSFALPEVKVHGNTVPATRVTSTFTNIFDIPAAHIDYSFQPVREAWVDIKPNDEFKLRIFPMAYEDQALTTDDPLRLSNNMEWWAESPWIDGWQQGNLNTGASPVNFTKGQWDKSLSYYTKDSDGQRLTALRGVSLQAKPTDETSLDATIATPKTLWENYDNMTALAGAARLKQFMGDLFYIGAVGTMHQGYNDNIQTDAENYAGAVDAGLMVLKGLKLSAEYAASKSFYDETSPQYTTKNHGNAYYVALTTASNPGDEDILRSKDYFGIHPISKNEDFYKSTIYAARMDQGFESSLSDYHGTRSDSFWDDHLTFYPSTYRYLPGIEPGMSQYDMEPFAIGNGIDYGRTVMSWRGDVNLMEGKFQGLADVRHVTDNDSHNIENVTRLQGTYEATDRLTTKALFLWDALPKTTAGVDPFLIVDNTAGQSLANTAVHGGKDPSLKTGSLGARYALTDWSALNGVWELTNDVNLNTDSFPQGDLNSSYFTTYTQNNRVYEQSIPFLYDQGSFHQAPYAYYNIFKTGLELTPNDQWHIYLDYTRNPNAFAGNIDDNMSHFGIEASYVPTRRVGFFTRYTLSRGYDINRLVNDHDLDFRDYHNFFFEMRMKLPKDVLMSIEYGVGPAYNIATSTSNPSLAFYATAVLQTQHIVRIIFDKKF